MKVLYHTDEIEKKLRYRAMLTAGLFDYVKGFDHYTHGYLQALKDMNVDEKYVEIYKKLIKRLRKSYKVGRPRDGEERLGTGYILRDSPVDYSSVD